jgi:ATP-dependent helicase HrpA
MMEVVGERVFGPDQNPRMPVPELLLPAHEVRNKRAFEKRLDAGWNQLGKAGSEACAIVEELLKEYQPLTIALSNRFPPMWDQAIADMRAQVQRLVYPGFLSHTPWRHLARVPIYLRAMRLRIERAAADPPHSVARDAQKLAEVAPFWRAWMELEAAHKELLAAERGRSPVSEFRWLIEEFRVSLFAQELRAAVPVSTKRLTQAWENLGGRG